MIERESGYIKLNKWYQCKVTIDKPMINLEGKDAYCGVDLSHNIGLTSCYFIIPHNGTYYIYGHNFMPEDAYHKTLNTPAYNDERFQGGQITLTHGSIVDYETIERHIINFAKENNLNIKGIGYDPFNATKLANSMKDKGYEMVVIPQVIAVLAASTKGFRDLVLDEKVVHDGDNPLAKAIFNAGIVQDINGNILFNKKDRKESVAPLSAVLNAYTLARQHKANHSETRTSNPIGDTVVTFDTSQLSTTLSTCRHEVDKLNEYISTLTDKYPFIDVKCQVSLDESRLKQGINVDCAAGKLTVTYADGAHA